MSSIIGWLKGVFDQRTASLVFPILAEQTLVMLMAIINSMMASHIGRIAVSAIGLVDSVNMLIISFFAALAVGATVIVAHYIAKDDIKGANETVKQSLYSALVLVAAMGALLLVFRRQLFGFLYGGAEEAVLRNTEIYFIISVISYPFVTITSIASGVLRGSSDSRTPMKVTFIMNIANVIFGYIGIFGIEIGSFKFGAWGIAGAAGALAAARGVGAVIALYILLRGTRNVRLSSPFRFRPHMGILKSVYFIGLPASIEYVLFHLGRIYTQTYIVAAGTTDIAANYFSGPISNILNLPGNALNLAAATLVGQALGSGDREKARRTLWNTLYLSMITTGLVCLIFFLVRKPFLSLYNPDAEVMGLVMFYIVGGCIMSPIFWPASFTLPAGLRSAGDARFCMIVSIATLWTVRVGLGYLLAVHYGMGARGVWIAMYADWIARGALYLWRLKSDRWGRKKILYDQ